MLLIGTESFFKIEKPWEQGNKFRVVDRDWELTGRSTAVILFFFQRAGWGWQSPRHFNPSPWGGWKTLDLYLSALLLSYPVLSLSAILLDPTGLDFHIEAGF